MQLITPFVEARPVWAKGRTGLLNDSVRFQAQFTAGQSDKICLRLTGCTLYRVRLNGAFVCYGPARGPKGIFRVDEVALPCQAGTNTLEIQMTGSNVNSYYYMDHPSFLQAEVYCGERILAWTGRDFQAFDTLTQPGPAAACARIRKVSRFSFQRMFAEAYELRQADQAPALELEECPQVPLLPRSVPQPEYAMDRSYAPVRKIRRRYAAEAVLKHSSRLNRDDRIGLKGFYPEELALDTDIELRRYVRDDNGPLVSTLFCGKCNNTGFLNLSIKCTKPGRMLVMTAEIEEPEGGINPARLGNVDAIFYDFQEAGTYHLEAMEANTFKFAEVLFDTAEGEILDFSLREFLSPLAWKTAFHTDDPALAQIYEAGRRTFAANAVDCFTDCPSRERGGWLCDSFFIGRTSFLLTGDTLLERVFLENFAYTDRFDHLPEGAFPMVFPADHPDHCFIPNWAMWLVIQLEDYLKRSNDTELKEAFRGKILGLVRYLDTFLNSDGLLEKLPSWVFIEWSKANDFVQDVNYPSNMTYAAVLDAVARMYGMPELSARAATMRDTIRWQSWNGKWFRDHAIRQQDGSLAIQDGDISETCQYYAFYFRTATPETYPELWNCLLHDFGPERIAKGLWPEIYPSNAFIGNYLRLELLSLAGFHQQLLQETKGYFQKMADRTGTLWEHDSTRASCCHGFAAYINVLLSRALNQN